MSMPAMSQFSAPTDFSAPPARGMPTPSPRPLAQQLGLADANACQQVLEEVELLTQGASAQTREFVQNLRQLLQPVCAEPEPQMPTAQAGVQRAPAYTQA